MKKFVLIGMFCAVFALCIHVQAEEKAPTVDPAAFKTWKQQVVVDAKKAGISPKTLDDFSASVEIVPRVLELMDQQPEFKLSFADYQKRILTKEKIAKANKYYNEHRAVLEKIGKEYGVQPRFIIALWGVESDFGRVMGVFNVVDSLATLGFKSRRADYFRGELIKALKIIDEGHITRKDMLGSWAGAMGQSQFMPSSFVNYAADFDGDGHKNIWSSRPDVFASIANYLSTVGWDDDQTWGRPVKLPKGFDLKLTNNRKIKKPISQWQAMGVRNRDGSALPKRELMAAIVLPEDKVANAQMVYTNYDAIMDWNRSLYFATTVGMLADRIGR